MSVDVIQNRQTRYVHLGEMDYQEAWDYQEQLFAEVVNRKIENRKSDSPIPTDNHLIFCYHPHVFTLGKSGKPEHLLLDDKALEEKGATYYQINRGGDITYHGPGQLVGYPILDLDNFFTDIHKYLRYLEEAIILTLAEYGIQAGRVKGLTGVWIEGHNDARARKICALGVKSSRWVTMHGFAFNVNTNLDYFEYIVPCGIPDKDVTSMERELGHVVDIKEVEKKVLSHLSDLFKMELFE